MTNIGRHTVYTVDQHGCFLASSDGSVMELYLEVSQYGAKASEREEVYKLLFYEKKGQLLILHDSSLSFCIFQARPFKLAVYKLIFSMLSGDKDSN